MPRISEFYGIVIEMYYADHPPPHFHARQSGRVGIFAIADGELIAGDLPGRARRLVRQWTLQRQSELETNWHRARRRQPPNPIAPLS